MAETTIDYSEFCKCIKEIQRLSDELNDGWRTVSDAEATYLIKEIKRTSKLKSSEVSALCLEDADYIESDDCVTDTATPARLTRWEYHIVYNLSYGVPMLCFNVWDSTGRLLGLKELWMEVEQKCGGAYMLTTLTQTDHPVLQTPFFAFHPCKTAEMLALFRNKSINIVISWLSIMAPIVLLDLPFRYSVSLMMQREVEK